MPVCQRRTHIEVTQQNDAIGDSNTIQNDLQIGAGFTGKLDEVRVWNVARGATEIARDYNRVVAADTSGLVGYWRFEEQDDGDPLANQVSIRPLTKTMAC